MGGQNNYSSAARRDNGGDRVTRHNGGSVRAYEILGRSRSVRRGPAGLQIPIADNLP